MFNYKISRQHTVEKETIRYATFDYRKIAGIEARTLPWTLQLFSHVPCVQKTNLDLATQRYDDATEFQKARGSGIYRDCINRQWRFH